MEAGDIHLSSVHLTHQPGVPTHHLKSGSVTSTKRKERGALGLRNTFPGNSPDCYPQPRPRRVAGVTRPRITLLPSP